MRCSAITILGLAVVASATWDGKFSYPPGIEPLSLANGNADFNIETFGPSKGPPSDCISVWHPPHPDVYIDDCDKDKEHGWHWVHPGKPKWWKHPGKDKDHDKPKKPDHDKPAPSCDKCNQPSQPDQTPQPDQPEQPAPTTTPQWKWTTSTITQTAISTVFSCPPSVTNCPGNGGGTQYTTVTVPAVVTICPVPVVPIPAPTTAPVPVAPPATTAPPVVPIPSVPSPPQTQSSAPAPPPVSSSPPEVPPVPSSAPVVVPPPAVTTKPEIGTVTRSDIGTVTRPNPTATTSRAVVTAGAVQNVQRAGGAVVAAVAAVAAFI